MKGFSRFSRKMTTDRRAAIGPLLLAVLLTILVPVPGIIEAQDGTSVRLVLPKDRVPAPSASLISLDNPERAAIVRHEITASVEPQTGGIEVTDRITIVHAPGAPSAEATSFLLWHGLEVTEAKSEPAVAFTALERMKARSLWHRPPYAELEGYATTRQYELKLEDSAATWPETLDVTLTYSGTIVDSLQAPESAYARSFETSAGIIVPEGIFLAGSSVWIPSRPDDIYSFELVAHSPPDWRVVSQGRMERSVERGGRRTDHWICRHPMNEIYLVAGPWEEHHLRLDDVMAQTFTYAATDSSIYNRYLRGTQRYLDLYEERIGPYPFEKFAMVENFWQTGYGMPSFTLLGDRVIRLPFILDTSYGHEILHNWWGNGVFVAAEEGNWCEGLTTYGADYLYKELEDEAGGRDYRWNALKGYLDYVSAGEDVPLMDFRERHDFATQAIGYGKAMMVFHQVRRELGDDAFTAALQSFYKEHLFQQASWTDLLTSFAKAHPHLREANRAEWIQAMHAQWIARTGAPVLRLRGAELEAGKGNAAAGRWITTLDLAQDDTASPFRIQVPVRLLGAESARYDTVLVVGAGDVRAEVRTTFEPRRIEVDPEFDVLRRLHREEIPASLSQVLGADSVLIVVANGLSPEMDAACREVAASWSTDHRAKILNEVEAMGTLQAMHGGAAVHSVGAKHELSQSGGQSVSGAMNGASAVSPGSSSSPPAIWFLGLGAAARSWIESIDAVELPSGNAPWTVAGAEYADGNGAVVTGAMMNGQSAWGCLASDDPATMRAMGRKVPHYGKYSYLVFAGEQNIGKGIWPVGKSPLTHDFASTNAPASGAGSR